MGTTQSTEDSIQTELLLRQIIELIQNAKPMLFSASVLVSQDEVLDLLKQALHQLPDEIRQSQWMVREREEFLANMHREGQEIVEEARVRAERMVQRTEIARQANMIATRKHEEARAEAKKLRHETDDYCDQKLASFELILDKLSSLVKSGREKIHSSALQDLNGTSGSPPNALLDQFQSQSDEILKSNKVHSSGVQLFDQDSI